MKIYTKAGDLGSTSLIGGTRVPKSHIRIESYGTVDELNSFIGLLSDLLTHAEIKTVLKEVQDRLFTVGSSLACDPEKEPLMKIPDLKEADIVFLENEIDKEWSKWKLSRTLQSRRIKLTLGDLQLFFLIIFKMITQLKKLSNCYKTYIV